MDSEQLVMAAKKLKSAVEKGHHRVHQIHRSEWPRLWEAIDAVIDQVSHEADIDLHSTMDATVWTEEFIKVMKRDPNAIKDEGWILGWFANALQTGYDFGVRSVLEEDERYSPTEVLVSDEGEIVGMRDFDVEVSVED